MAGYTRQDTNDNIATGKVINATDFDNEYNAIQTAFNASGGHKHDGTAAEGARITVIGPAGQATTDANAFFSTTTATIGLGKTGNVWKDLHVDNIKIDGNTVSTINTNGNIELAPNGAGLVNLQASGDLAIGGVALTANSTEFNVLAGLTATTAELNILDGSTTVQATVTLADADGVVISDADDSDTMKQALVSDIATYVSSKTMTMTNKTIDANGAGNNISNIEVDNFNAATIITQAEGIGSNDNETTIPTSAAVKDYADNAVSAIGTSNFAASALVTEAEGLNSSDNDTSIPTTAAVKDYVDTKDTDSGADYGTSSNPHVFVVTVAAKTASHPYYGDGSSDCYFINGIESPVLELNGHDQTSGGEYYYKFDLRHSSVSGHHLIFYEDAAKNKSFEYTKLTGTNVTFGSGTAGDGSANAWTMLKVSNDTPNKLYYQCNSHAFMGNHIKTGNLSPGLNDHHTIEMGNLKFTNNKIETIDNNTTGSTNSGTANQGHALILDTHTNGASQKEPVQVNTWMKVYGNHGATSNYVNVGIASGGGDDLVVAGTSTPTLSIQENTNSAGTVRGEFNILAKDDTNTGRYIFKMEGHHATRASGSSHRGGAKLWAKNNTTWIDSISLDADTVVINEGGSALLDFRVESDNSSHAIFVDSDADALGLMNSSPNTNFAVDASGTGGFKAKKYVEQHADVTSASGVTINCEDGNTFAVTMGHNITFTFSNPPITANGFGFTLKLTQDGTGSRTATWPASVKWAGGSAPTLTGTAASVDIFTFYTHDAGTTWYGFTAGLDVK